MMPSNNFLKEILLEQHFLHNLQVLGLQEHLNPSSKMEMILQMDEEMKKKGFGNVSGRLVGVK